MEADVIMPEQMQQIPERRGRGWSLASLAAAGAALAVVSTVTYSGRTWIGEWLGLIAASVLILTGLISGLAAGWRACRSRLSMWALMANVLAVVGLCVWWIWPTPRSFIHAVNERNVAAARFALLTGMDVEEPEMWGMGVRIKGRSPLTIAAGNGDTKMARLLLEWGADVNRKDSNGDYPLFHAAWCGHPAMVKLLLEAGADPAAVGNDGSALHIAAGMGHLDVMDLLLAEGVSINLADRKGNTPLDSAQMSGNAAAMEYLREKGGTRRNTLEEGSQ